MSVAYTMTPFSRAGKLSHVVSVIRDQGKKQQLLNREHEDIFIYLVQMNRQHLHPRHEHSCV